MTIVDRVGLNVKWWREKRNLTQAALAEAAGFTRIYVAKIEAGDKLPTLETLEKLAKVLRVKLPELLK